MNICKATPKTLVIPPVVDSGYWLVQVDTLPAPEDADYDHAYILPDDSVYVLSHDGTQLVPIGSSGSGGQPTLINNTDNFIVITGSGTYSVTVGLNEVTLETLIQSRIEALIPDGNEVAY